MSRTRTTTTAVVSLRASRLADVAQKIGEVQEDIRQRATVLNCQSTRQAHSSFATDQQFSGQSRKAGTSSVSYTSACVGKDEDSGFHQGSFVPDNESKKERWQDWIPTFVPTPTPKKPSRAPNVDAQAVTSQFNEFPNVNPFINVDAERTFILN